MSEFKGTQGPWEIRYGAVAESDEGFGIGPKIVGELGIIAECWPCTTTAEGRRQIAANARLIAAAPELLAACQLLVEEMESRFDMGSRSTNPGIKVAVEVGLAAIAEALGEQQ
jgi:hypothetical protein